MPRKLPEHGKSMRFYLEQSLPQDWRIVPIEGRAEDDVARILTRTSIFLSFSDREGCPLPPLETALSGALVIGYTGQGAREYFRGAKLPADPLWGFRGLYPCGWAWAGGR